MGSEGTIAGTATTSSAASPDVPRVSLDAAVQEILRRQEKMETMLSALIQQRQVQDWYDTNTAAQILGKAPYSVREWCRLGRVRAEKRTCGHGKAKEWMISHEELMRIKSEGLLPQTRVQ